LHDSALHDSALHDSALHDSALHDSAPRLVLDEISEVSLPAGEYTGQVKWFNDRLGYGFCTVISDGRYKGRDIFAHHSGIRPMSSNYKTLRKGEYINFNVMNGHNGLQAIDVTGINGGPLMCDVAPMRNRMLDA
jgi:CspA family cold shock protein